MSTFFFIVKFRVFGSKCPPERHPRAPNHHFDESPGSKGTLSPTLAHMNEIDGPGLTQSVIWRAKYRKLSIFRLGERIGATGTRCIALLGCGMFETTPKTVLLRF